MKNLIYGILFTFILLPMDALGRSYPVKEVSKPGCRFTNWAQLDQDCKQNLPIIKGADYNKYKNNTEYRITYSVLWSSTYKNGWDIGYGSHLGVDIASAEGTPVYSISNGTVYVAGSLSGRGKTVVIEHTFNNKKIYSVYAHLSQINVTKGNSVIEGAKIGEIGSTGNSTGNHLHFQIDTNEKGFHPYYHNGCKGKIEDIVNGGLCNEFVTANTIDPIYFLENNGANLIISQTQEQINNTSEKIKEENRINPIDLVSMAEIQKRELELFLHRFQIKITSKIDSNVIHVGNKGTIEISAINKKYNRTSIITIPDSIDIVFSNNIVESFPKSIRYLDGKRKIEIKGLREGLTSVYFKIGNSTIGSEKIRIISDTTEVTPEKATATILGNQYLGNDTRGAVYMRDSLNVPIISTPFKGEYIIEGSENVLFCEVNLNDKNRGKISDINCPKDKLKKYIKFDYSKSYKGIFVFKIFPTSLGNNSITVKNDKNKIVANYNKKSVKVPKDLKKNSLYYDYIFKTHKALITTNLKSGYFIPKQTAKQDVVNLWLDNAFKTKSSISGNRFIEVSRIEFIKLLSKKSGIVSKNKNKVFLDIDEENLKYANILIDYNAGFLDKYGNKYLQPNKSITREEAAYLISKIKSL
ncbi:MAG: peptidoglycan DD-metalloendopeptidase family protein [Candidatus Absconditabacteria bacterium]